MLISRSFTELMLYRVCLTLSYQILAVTVGWHIYDITRNPLTLGLVGLAEVVPYFCAALFAGHAVDVMSKKKIAIMGCIVNGPGEMADADFGYVGGAPGKINLYVGKKPVKFNIPEVEAVDRLVDLIKEHGKWAEAEA